jgi:hypothetical protein
VESAELRRLITEFDGTTESAERLEAQTLKVKTATDAQSKAILAVNQSNRVQNFQIIESLRLVRTFTSAFSNLNQVYQTLLLRQISTTQSTLAQDQAFEKLSAQSAKVFRALNIFGPQNEEVKAGFDSIIDSTNLTTDALEKTKKEWELYRDTMGLSADKIEFANEQIEKLNRAIEESKLKDKQKEFEDFFGIIAAGGTAVGTMGQLALSLSATATGVRALNLALASSPYILAFFAALEVLNQAGIIDTPSITSLITGKTHKEIRDAPGIGSVDIESRFPNGVQPRGTLEKTEINLYVDKLSTDGSVDLSQWLQKAYEQAKIEESKKVGHR